MRSPSPAAGRPPRGGLGSEGQVRVGAVTYVDRWEQMFPGPPGPALRQLTASTMRDGSCVGSCGQREPFAQVWVVFAMFMQNVSLWWPGDMGLGTGQSHSPGPATRNWART